MGNRAVITTRENFDNNGVGVYLHWNGGRDSVEAFLMYCKIKGYRSPDMDNYGWAYLATTIGNYFGDGLSLAVDKVENLDCNNFDNGVYIIKNWEIVDREFKENGEQHEYDLIEMLKDINDSQPGKIRMLDSELVEVAEAILRSKSAENNDKEEIK